MKLQHSCELHKKTLELHSDDVLLLSVYAGYDILIFISDLLNLDMKSLEQLEQQLGGGAYFSSTFTDINKALPAMLCQRYSRLAKS